MPDRLIEILIAWFPMLLLVAVWVFFMRSMQTGKWQSHAQKINLEILAEQRRHNAELEKILTRMDERIGTLERQLKP